MRSVIERLDRQCGIVGGAELLVAAAHMLSGYAERPDALDLWRLPIVAHMSLVVAEAQARAFRGWATTAATRDALLARELRRLAEALEAVAEPAARSSRRAHEFAQSESFDQALGGLSSVT